MLNKELTREGLHQQYRAEAEQLELSVDVLSDGPVNASVAFVGEGPGETEVRKGLPFVGGSGAFLFNSVGRYGIRRHEVYTTNVVKRQISLSTRSADDRHTVLRDELEKWIGLLHWELSQLPNVRTVFCLGNIALEALTGHVGITNWRGSVLDCDLPNGKKGRVVAGYNPAYPLRPDGYSQEAVFLSDCAKLDQVVRGTFKAYDLEEIINPTYKEAMGFIRELKKQKLPVGLDIEAINNELACIGLGNDPYRAMCINFRDLLRNRFTVQQEADIMLAVQSLCDSHQIVIQNAQFEGYFMWLKARMRVVAWFDTLLAHHTLYPLWPHRLQFLTAQYTNHPFYKDDGTAWKEGGDINVFWRYNCKDVGVMMRIYQRELQELKDQKLDKFFFDHVMRAQPHLVEATVHGIKQDETIKAKVLEQAAEDVAKLEAECHRLVHEATGDKHYHPNLNSHPQMRELYFERLKMHGRGQSTDKANRITIAKDPRTTAVEKELLAAIDRYKSEDKYLGTYAGARAGEDGRMRCEYKQYGVTRAPGRLSSSALLTGEGLNQQNQPMRARATYVADPDCVFTYFDLSQAEARVVAYRADIPTWKEQFERARLDGSYDCHRALASDMFRVAYDLVPTKDWDDDNKPTIRYKAKRCRHGLNYRMERWKLAEVTQLPFHEAARCFAIYHRVTPQLVPWWKAEEANFRKHHEVFNALGRRFRAIQRIEDTVLDSIVAFYPQSTVGDKVVQVWYQSQEDDDWPAHARICIDVHDNLVAMSAPRFAKTCLRIMKKYAEAPILIQDAWHRKHEPLIIPAELKMSYPSKAVFKRNRLDFVESTGGLHRWSHMHTVKL